MQLFFIFKQIYIIHFMPIHVYHRSHYLMVNIFFCNHGHSIHTKRWEYIITRTTYILHPSPRRILHSSSRRILHASPSHIEHRIPENKHRVIANWTSEPPMESPYEAPNIFWDIKNELLVEAKTLFSFLGKISFVRRIRNSLSANFGKPQ